MKSKIFNFLTRIFNKVLRILASILCLKSKNTYVKVKLYGGLCNKLFNLFSICDIAIKNNYVIIEPYFGWKNKVLFSEIYDLNAFNNYMRKYNNGHDLMISRNKYMFNLRVINNNFHNTTNLWEYSQSILENQRTANNMSRYCMNILALQALKIKKDYLSIVDYYSLNKQFTAIQIRTESDWVLHTKNKVFHKDETVLINSGELVKMIKETSFVDDVFFTSGEGHSNLLDVFKKNNLTADFYFNPKLEYEINAAINFEICCNAKHFIGLSRSTYSNLISLKRALNNNEESYIYNLGNKIQKRVDKGLHTEAKKSISLLTEII